MSGISHPTDFVIEPKNLCHAKGADFQLLYSFFMFLSPINDRYDAGQKFAADK